MAAVPQTAVYVDSGIRTAEHVAAALALGARGVFIGRPALWALAADGAAGVGQLLTAMTADLALVMKQLGVARVSDLTPDVICRSMIATRLAPSSARLGTAGTRLERLEP